MVGYYRLNNLGFTLDAGAHVLPRTSYEALDAANQLVSSAEAARDDILRQAKLAYAEERRRGYEDGLEESRLEALRTLLYESVELDKGLHAVERDLVRVVSDCVRKIIANFDNAEIAEALVRAAMQQMKRERSVELRVSTDLFDHFRKKVDEILSEYQEIHLLDVVVDTTLAPDQLILETSIGRVEINVGQRIEDILSVIQSAHIRTAADSLDALRSANGGAET